ncbi:hypothetical protein FN976_25665 [Caenimonas sedimenti]|uniref:KfrA N-terminal DNA-binding domain-containing protein n=1 Tax=Caenimonas sedimenti TaxID=2596921 RepID=A0A562ZHH6_9BURK|nr:hypothetical protein FN976_25665 [Caenimonas sedimenti]
MQYEEVFAAAEAMLSEGKLPSVRGLRARIGGSPNDIAPLLAKWRADGGDQRILKLRSSSKPQGGSVWNLGDAAYLDAIEAYFSDAETSDAGTRLERAERCLHQVLAAHRLIRASRPGERQILPSGRSSFKASIVQ